MLIYIFLVLIDNEVNITQISETLIASAAIQGSNSTPTGIKTPAAKNTAIKLYKNAQIMFNLIILYVLLIEHKVLLELNYYLIDIFLFFHLTFISPTFMS